MSKITTHVLDTSRGRPAAGIDIRLEILGGAPETWRLLGEGETDADGRLASLLAGDAGLEAATYRLTFATGTYFEARGVTAFYPSVQIVFQVRSPREHYHVPLLLNPFGYSTYRGS